MSSSLLLFCSRSFSLRTSLLNPTRISQLRILSFSTKKPPYSSLKPKGVQNPFREPADDKSRRLKLQEHIRFRDKHRLDNDFELIYAMPRERMYSAMHFFCTCACASMLVFVAIQFHRDMLDLEPIINSSNEQIPQFILNGIATILGIGFGTGLVVFFLRDD